MRRFLAGAVALIACNSPVSGRATSSPHPSENHAHGVALGSRAERSVEERLAEAADHAADPEVRADASFRLAVLVSERERAIPSTDLPARLARPISILRRIARDHPAYPSLFHVEYELAHDLLDAGRMGESMQVFRSLVCRDRYAYPVLDDPRDPERDQVLPLPQDRAEPFWRAWESAHSTPCPLPSRRSTRPKRSASEIPTLARASRCSRRRAQCSPMRRYGSSLAKRTSTCSLRRRGRSR